MDQGLNEPVPLRMAGQRGHTNRSRQESDLMRPRSLAHMLAGCALKEKKCPQSPELEKQHQEAPWKRNPRRTWRVSRVEF